MKKIEKTEKENLPGAAEKAADEPKEQESKGGDAGQAEETGEGAKTAPAEKAAPAEAKTTPEEAPKAEEPAAEPPAPAEEAAPEPPAAEAPAAEPPAPEADAGGDALRTLKADLLAARSQLAAYAAGVSPAMIADAVTLATAEAQSAGEVTEEAVTKAMGTVLKRHPEWKGGGDGKKPGGFKLGADPEKGAGKKTAGGEKAADKTGAKRWNRFK